MSCPAMLTSSRRPPCTRASSAWRQTAPSPRTGATNRRVAGASITVLRPLAARFTLRTNKTGMQLSASSSNSSNVPKGNSMNRKLEKYLNDAFKPYGEFPALNDVKQEMLSNLQEKYADLKAQGRSDEEAYRLTTESLGDIREIMEQLPR